MGRLFGCEEHDDKARCRLIYSFVALIGIWPTSAALAQLPPPPPISRCIMGLNPDERFAVCTEIIQSGSESLHDRAAALDTRGGFYLSKGQSDRAILDYDEALKLDPNYINLYQDRGNAYRARGDYDRAIQDYNEAIRRGSDLALVSSDLAAGVASIFSDRGKAYSMKGDNNRAIQDYDEAIRLYPNWAVAFYNRGIARRALGDFSSADADIARAKQIDPTIGQ